MTHMGTMLPKLGWIFCVLIGAGVAASAGAEERRAVVIRDVTVIDAVHGVRAVSQVVVEDGTIVSAGGSEKPPAPGARIIDGSGKFLIPGLWDAHVHLTYDPRMTDAMLGLFTAYGITSVRDTGGQIQHVTAVRERAQALDLPAPRIFVAGPLLDGELVVYDGNGRPEIGTSVPSSEVADAVVADLAGRGADFIKIYEMVEPEVFAALAAAAKRRGLPIAAHVPLSMTATEVGPSIDSLEHLRNVEFACAADAESLLRERLRRIRSPNGESGYQVRRSLHATQRPRAFANIDESNCNDAVASMRDTMQVPTLRLNAVHLARVYRRDDWYTALRALPDAVRVEWSESGRGFRDSREKRDLTRAEWSLSLVDRMHRARVPMGAGTDTPIMLAIPGFSLHTELELLVRGGLTPLEAIEAATLQPARFFSIDDEVGSIAPGMRADLLLLDANPVDDIRHTTRIAGVLSKGVWLEGDALRRVRRPAAAQPGSDPPSRRRGRPVP